MHIFHTLTPTFLWIISSPLAALERRQTRSLHVWCWWDEIIQICTLYPEIKEQKVELINLWAFFENNLFFFSKCPTCPRGC